MTDEPTKAALAEEAEQIGVPKSGTKAELEERIETAYRTDKYLSGKWHGKPNYSCPECSFSTVLGRRTIEIHIADAHRTTRRLASRRLKEER